MSLDRKRWAQRAHDLQLDQLSAVRARAEQWRNGLVGLTALLAVVTIVDGPDSADKLPPDVLDNAVALLSSAFSLLVVGTLLTMFAAFGVPGRKQLLTGESLEQWERTQAGQARAALIIGATVFVVGLVLVGSATRVVVLNSGPATKLLQVHTDRTSVCGRLVASSDNALTIDLGSAGATSTTVIAFSDVVELQVPEVCPASSQ